MQQIQKALKSGELMRDLARADYSTVKTFVTNNVTAERLLADVLTSVNNTVTDLSGGKFDKDKRPAYGKSKHSNQHASHDLEDDDDNDDEDHTTDTPPDLSVKD